MTTNPEIHRAQSCFLPSKDLGCRTDYEERGWSLKKGDKVPMLLATMYNGGGQLSRFLVQPQE